MTGRFTLRRGQPTARAIARADRLWWNALAVYALALVAITTWVQLCWHG